MVLHAKADDLEVFRDFVIDFEVARKYEGTEGYVYNHDNQVPYNLKGELIQAI